jgi:hypothetical protein
MQMKTDVQRLVVLISTVWFMTTGSGLAQETDQRARADQSSLGQSTYTAVGGLRGARPVKEIWSSNKNFFASVDHDRKVTTVYKVEWRENIGRSEKSWSLDGTFETAWLSNDGRHLIAGNHANNLLPLNFDKEEVMLRFFRTGQRLNQIAIHELIEDFSKLRKTEAGYDWGRYLGLNSAEYFVVKSIEQKIFLFDIMTGQPTTFKPRAASALPGWDIFQDVMRCYEFQYPSDLLLDKALMPSGMPSDWTFLKRKDGGWIIGTSVEDADVFFPASHNPARRSFEVFVTDRAGAMFCADGPTGSRFIKGVVSQRRFTNPNGLLGIELFLLEVEEENLEDEKETKAEERTIGPVYALSISQPDESHRVLFLRLNHEQPEFSQARELLENMVNTVRVLR